MFSNRVCVSFSFKQTSVTNLVGSKMIPRSPLGIRAQLVIITFWTEIALFFVQFRKLPCVDSACCFEFFCFPALSATCSLLNGLINPPWVSCCQLRQAFFDTFTAFKAFFTNFTFSLKFLLVDRIDLFPHHT